MVEPTILLFDIDGTLLSADGAGRRALVRAFAQVVGEGSAIARADFRGMTDHALVRQSLSAQGLEPTDDLLEAILGRYVAALDAELAVGSTCLLPGVRELLERLANAERSWVGLGLGTGNVEAGAHKKLTAVGLADYFAFGGYGSDHEDRAEVLAIGALRGASWLGVARSKCRVVVIGDTRHDIDAAHRIGARAVAVTTGGVDATRLLHAGADAVFEDLSDPRICGFLLGTEQN